MGLGTPPAPSAVSKLSTLGAPGAMERDAGKLATLPSMMADVDGESPKVRFPGQNSVRCVQKLHGCR